MGVETFLLAAIHAVRCPDRPSPRLFAFLQDGLSTGHGKRSGRRHSVLVGYRDGRLHRSLIAKAAGLGLAIEWCCATGEY